MSKGFGFSQAMPVEEDPGDQTWHHSTIHDRMDMERLGKRQETKRNFRYLSLVGFIATIMYTWSAQLSTTTLGLRNGGLAGMVWTYVFTSTGFMISMACIAEMNSMAPTSGGQYHWVSEFAPPNIQKVLSYITGWMCVLSWQTLPASFYVLAAGIVQGLLKLNNPDYDPKPWQGTLLIIAFASFSIMFNTVLARHLPLVEGMILLLHIFGFFSILIPLWTIGPRNSAERVFTEFTDRGGWNNIALSVCVGLLSPTYSLTGADGSTHMSEEILDASRVVPIAMMSAVALNIFFGLIMIITYCFCITDIDAALEHEFAFIHVFSDAVRSQGATNIMVSFITVMAIFGGIASLASTSRQLFAFARDGGVPFSRCLSKVHARRKIPMNAVFASFAATSLLSLVNLGSTKAFNAATSLVVTASYSSYILCIACMVRKRIRDEKLPPARWSLGRWGLPLNIISLFYLAIVLIFSFFPPKGKLLQPT